LIRADGGIYITNVGGPAPYDRSKLINTVVGAYLSEGGVWTNASDSARKENFTPVDRKDLLEKLAALPITTWNYRNEADSVRHLGPIAQDFFALFGLGNDNTSISTLDPSGVALAAIQQLYATQQELTRRTEEVTVLRTELSDVKHELDELKRQVASILEQRGVHAGAAKLAASQDKLHETPTVE